MVVTAHAKVRFRERVGSRQELRMEVQKAWKQGLKREETTGALHYYLTSLCLRRRWVVDPRIYRSTVYVFVNRKLITVFNLPPYLCQAADAAMAVKLGRGSSPQGASGDTKVASAGQP